MAETERPKTLVVYFSRAGHTARMAREIARRCHSDLDEIHEIGNHASWIGRIRGAWHAFTRGAPPIRMPLRNPARYDLVIIGAPCWRFGLAPAVRTYIRRHASVFPDVAFFCAEGSRDEVAFAELSRLCGKSPVATFAVQRKNLPPVANLAGVTDFMDHLHLF